MPVIDPMKVALDELPVPVLKKEDTALLVVDMQYYDASPDFGLVENCRKLGVDMTYYVDRLALITKNIAKLIGVCRETGVEVIYCTIEALTNSGKDRSNIHKNTGFFAGPGSKGAEIIEELKPLPGEILLRKTCSGVFNGTNIDQLLHNLGIQNLIVVGVLTNQCVDTAVRDAGDRGYCVTLLEDGCAAVHPSLHQASIEILRGLYCQMSTTDETIAKLRADNA